MGLGKLLPEVEPDGTGKVFGSEPLEDVAGGAELGMSRLKLAGAGGTRLVEIGAGAGGAEVLAGAGGAGDSARAGFGSEETTRPVTVGIL